MLKKRFLTEKMAPSAQASGARSTSSEPSISRRVPSSAPRARVRSSTCATAAMEGNASPRKPIVRREKRPSAAAIFDVACRSKAMRASVSDMPLPLSITCTSVRPASLMMTVIWSAPASTAFSISSLTTEAGRWMTSPAAIWLAMWSGSKWMMSLILCGWGWWGRAVCTRSLWGLGPRELAVCALRGHRR